MSCIFLNAYKFYFHMWKCSSFSCSLFLHCRNVVPYPWTISLVWVKKTRGHLAQQWLSSHSATPSTLLSENILKYRKSPQSNAYFWDKGISAYLSLSVVIMKAHSTYNALFFFFPSNFLWIWGRSKPNRNDQLCPRSWQWGVFWHQKKKKTMNFDTDSADIDMSNLAPLYRYLFQHTGVLKPEICTF